MKKIGILFLIAAFFLQSCGNEASTPIENTDPVVKVKMNKANSESSSDYVMASGKIEAENSANVSTRMMGYITKLNVKVGQKVQQGQLLVSINSSDLQAKKAQVDASILQVKAGFENAKKDYERFKVLFQQQSASQKELDDMTSRYEMAKAGLEGAEQMRNEVNAQFSYSNVAAPFTGVVTNTFVKEGDMANPGMPLVSIEGLNTKQVTAMVSESEISAISNGMAAKVFVKSINKEINGTVIEVSRSAKNTGGQYLVKIALENSDASVLSGMFVNVQFPIKNLDTKTKNGFTVPESALVTKGQLTGIYTISDKNIAILRWIRTGKTVGNQVQVLSGLSANESYIVSADGKLYNGVKVSF